MHRRVGRALVTLLLVALAAGQAPPAPIPNPADREILPKPTQEGVAALQRLMKACVEGGAVQFLPRSRSGPSRVIVVDGARLGAILREHRQEITPALCDTLLTTSL